MKFNNLDNVCKIYLRHIGFIIYVATYSIQEITKYKCQSGASRYYPVLIGIKTTFEAYITLLKDSSLFTERFSTEVLQCQIERRSEVVF